MGSLELDETSESETEAVTQEAVASTLAWGPAVGPIPLGFGWDSEPVVMDWHGHGEPDLLVSAGGGELGRQARIYRPVQSRDDAPRHYDAGTPIEALAGLRCLAPVRNGRSSRFDLVGLDAKGLVYLANQNDSGPPEFGPRAPLGLGPDLGLGPCRVVQIASVDWDGDGLDDLLVGIDDLTGYWPDGDRVPPAQRSGFNQQGGHPGYDQNGLWRGRPPVGRIFWLKNVGQAGSPAFELQPEIQGDTHPLDLGMRPSPLAVAWERPAGLQLLTTDRRGLIQVHRNFGDQRPPVLMEPRTMLSEGAPFHLPDDLTVILAADLDGDRRDELIFGTSDGRVYAVHAGPDRREVDGPRVVLHEGAKLWLGGQAVVAAGDIDGDGGLDLLAGTASGRILLLRDVGGGSHDHRYKTPAVVEAGGVPFQMDPGPDGMLNGPVFPRLGYASPALVDWSGHGRLDILVGGAGGDVVLLRNDGSSNDPRFASPAPLRCQGMPVLTPPRVRPAFAAWTGKAELDLISLNLQGFLCVYPREGKAEVGPPLPLVDRLGRYIRLDGGFGLSGRCSLWAGDWRGSGQADLLVGLPRANRHVVAAITGEPFESVEAIPTVLLLENLGHGVLSPRPVRHVDGRPLVLGAEGCSPAGIASASGSGMDLLVGQDDGSVELIPRDALRW